MVCYLCNVLKINYLIPRYQCTIHWPWYMCVCVCMNKNNDHYYCHSSAISNYYFVDMIPKLHPTLTYMLTSHPLEVKSHCWSLETLVQLDRTTRSPWLLRQWFSCLMAFVDLLNENAYAQQLLIFLHFLLCISGRFMIMTIQS